MLMLWMIYSTPTPHSSSDDAEIYSFVSAFSMKPRRSIVKQADFVKYLWYFSAHDSVFTYAEHQQRRLPPCTRDNPLVFFMRSNSANGFYKTASRCEFFSRVFFQSATKKKTIAWEIKRGKFRHRRSDSGAGWGGDFRFVSIVRAKRWENMIIK